MFSTYSVTTTLVSAFTRHCVPLHACLAQHLTEGARSRAWAAHDETVVHERALDVVHLADLSASRRQADDCMVQGTSVVVRHQVIRRAYFVTTRQAKEHANECSLSRCTRPAEQMKPTYGIASSIQHPQHAPQLFPAHVTPLSAGSCSMTCPNRQHGQQHPMQQPGVLKQPKSPVFHVDMMTRSRTEFSAWRVFGRVVLPVFTPCSWSESILRGLVLKV